MNCLVLFVNNYYIVNVHDMMRITRVSLYKGLTKLLGLLFYPFNPTFTQ